MSTGEMLTGVPQPSVSNRTKHNTESFRISAMEGAIFECAIVFVMKIYGQKVDFI